MQVVNTLENGNLLYRIAWASLYVKLIAIIITIYHPWFFQQGRKIYEKSFFYPCTGMVCTLGKQ